MNISDIKGKVDYLILSIRKDEYEAVLRRFPNRITVSAARGKTPCHFLIVETLNDRRVGVAISRILKQGHDHAQAVARNLIDDLWPNWLFLVGIAGGFADNEYTLGDVLLASHLYDFSVSAALEGKIPEYSVGGGPMHLDVEALLSMLPAEERALEGWNTLQQLGMEKLKEKIPERLPRGNSKFYGRPKYQEEVRASLFKHFSANQNPREPIFWIAPAASSSTLVKDTKLAQVWKKSARDAASVEMELGGVYLAARHGGNGDCRVLAVRGLSDIVGYKRSPGWTDFACEAAASFAHALIKSGIPQNYTSVQSKKIDPQPPDTIDITHLARGISYEIVDRDKRLTDIDKAWHDPQCNLLIISGLGGTGKTSLVNHWLCNPDRAPRASADGPDSGFAWTFFREGASTDEEVSSEWFFRDACKHFRIEFQGTASLWDKGRKLAETIKNRRALLVLDGLEILQERPGQTHRDGYFRDSQDGVLKLLKSLASDKPGRCLCVVTTQWPIAELKQFPDNWYQEMDLDHLDERAGAELLRKLLAPTNVSPEQREFVNRIPEAELRRASREFDGYALALTLLGNYLSAVHGGDIRKRNEIPSLENMPGKIGDPAKRVMAKYKDLLRDDPAIDILYLMGLFDRPVKTDIIDLLRSRRSAKRPADYIHRFFAKISNEQEEDGPLSRLQKLRDDELQDAVSRLRDLGLISPPKKVSCSVMDCNSIIREYFGMILRTKYRHDWLEAHRRLYDFYQRPTEKQPETLAEMEPLYRAISHGCAAGLQKEAYKKIYWKRIWRGEDAVTLFSHAAISAENAALACFFDSCWKKPSSNLTAFQKVAVLGRAGLILRVLGRLREAQDANEAALRLVVKLNFIRPRDKWYNAAIIAFSKCDLLLTIGKISQSEAEGRDGVKYADRSKHPILRMVLRALHANVLHQLGHINDAGALFEKAEVEQVAKTSVEESPTLRFLSAVSVYKFSNYLLDIGKSLEAKGLVDRFEQALTAKESSVIDQAFIRLGLGEALIVDAERGNRDSLEQAKDCFDYAVRQLRKFQVQDLIVRSLLGRARLRRVLRDWENAKVDLDEVLEIDERGEMKLHLADFHLEAALLSLAQGDKSKARAHTVTASQMVLEMSYNRRKSKLKRCGSKPA